MPTITQLYIKKAKGEPMHKADSLDLLRGYGIKNDINRNPISPRQILITRKEDLDELHIPYGGLRENIVIGGAKADSFVPGALLNVGSTVKIRLTFYCEPCKRIADVVPSLRAVINRRGILGVIIEGGEIIIGDNVSCFPNEFDPLSEVPYERFLNFIKFVPHGKVVTYKMITMGMGVADSYIRAIPKYIEKCLTENMSYPLHRIVDTTGTTIDCYVPDQIGLLKREKIEVISENVLFENNIKHLVPLGKYLWHGSSLYLNNPPSLANNEALVDHQNLQHCEA